MASSSVRLRRAQRAMIDQLMPEIRAAFIESVQNIRDEVVLRQLVEAIRDKNIDKAIEMLHIEEAAFEPYRKAINDTYLAGGKLATNVMPRWVAKNG